MKEYPSIPKVLDKFIGRECVSFEKYDGSNLSAEYSVKRGWYKFSTRTHLFSESEPTFGCAIGIFKNTLAEPLEKIIRDTFPKVEGATAYFEFVGPHSFAGIHDPGILQVSSNDPKELVLFDVNITKKGFIPAKQFIDLFKNVRSAEPLYTGPLTEDFIKAVREGKFSSNEGVVCKGQLTSSIHTQWSCKIKTWFYLKKIQKYFGTSYGRYWE